MKNNKIEENLLWLAKAYIHHSKYKEILKEKGISSAFDDLKEIKKSMIDGMAYGYIPIPLNIKLGGGRTTAIRDFVKAINTWEGLQAERLVSCTPAKINKIISEGKIEDIIIIKKREGKR